MIKKLPNADKLITADQAQQQQQPFAPGNLAQNDIVLMVHKINELVDEMNKTQEMVNDLNHALTNICHALTSNPKPPSDPPE